jgi:spore germination cell wall hydrolase CwlJ-like protein
MGMIRQHRILSGITAFLVLLTLTVWASQHRNIPEMPDPVATTTVPSISFSLDLEAQYTLPNRLKTIDEPGEAVITPLLSPNPTETTTAPVSPTPSATPSATPIPSATPVPLETDANGVYQENRPIDEFTVDNSAIYIKSFNANIRTLPRTDADIIVKVAMGDKLTRTGYGNYWSQVKTAKGETGYVLTSLISTTVIYKPAPTSTPKPSATPRPVSTVAPTAAPTTKPAAGETPTPDATDAEKPDTSETTAPVATPTAPAEHSDEFHLFARIISLEGHAPSGYDSYLSVATVIMNQVAHKSYPNTVTGVVSYPGRFSTYSTAASGRPATYSSAVYQAASDAYYHGKRNLPAYVIAFITPDAYERNVAAGGSFSKMEVYKVAYNAVWCYYARDAS